jgi:hypothetical protein
MLIYVLRWRPSWISDRPKKHTLCRGRPNDHSWAVWFQLFEPYGKMLKCLLLRNYKYDYSQTVHECSLDGPLQTLLFLFRYEIQNVLEDHPMNIHVQFGFNHICSF